VLYVNLVEERLRVRARMGAVIRYGTLGLIVLAVVVGTLLSIKLFQARSLGHQMNAVRGEIKDLKPSADQCKQVIIEIAKLNPLWQLADDATVSQQTWGLVLRGLSDGRPKYSYGMISLEGADTQTSDKDKPARITVRGFATSEFAIAEYQRNLNEYKTGPEAPLVFNPGATKLNEVNSAVREGMSVKNFVMELSLNPGEGGAPSGPK